LISGQTSDDIFNVPIGNFFLSNENIKVNFTDMTVANLKEQLSRTKEVIGAKITKMNLWKVELKTYEVNNLSAEDIESHERSEKMETTSNLNEYYNNNEDKNPKKGHLHVFIVPTDTGKCLPMLYLSNKKFAVETMIHISSFINNIEYAF
jgi:hypothetical protein